MNLHLTTFVSGIAPLLFLLTTTASGTFIESEQSNNFDIIYDKPAYCTTANYDCYVNGVPKCCFTGGCPKKRPQCELLPSPAADEDKELTANSRHDHSMEVKAIIHGLRSSFLRRG